MSSTTDPTVLSPTATDTDDDDDDESSTLHTDPPATTQQPVGTVDPGLSSTMLVTTTAPGVNPSISVSSTAAQIHISLHASVSSATELADRASPTALIPAGSATETNASGDGGLGTGASAGVGVGVALVVCLAAVGVWFFLRRQSARRTKTRCASCPSADEEGAPTAPKSHYAYRAGPVAELSGEEKPRRWEELAEVGGAQVERAELPASAVPTVRPAKGGGERLFADAPIDQGDELDDADERAVDRKDERLFSDPPIYRMSDILQVERPQPAEKKN